MIRYERRCPQAAWRHFAPCGPAGGFLERKAYAVSGLHRRSDEIFVIVAFPSLIWPWKIKKYFHSLEIHRQEFTSQSGFPMEVEMLSTRKILTTGIAAATFAVALAAVTPAQAWGRGGFGGGGWGHRAGWGYGGGWGRRGVYYGGGWGYRGGYYGGGWGYPGYGAGLAGAAIGGAVVGAAIANSNRCYQHYPRYDAWGNFVGYTTGVGACY